MSRFGIRKRVKGLLGRTEAPQIIQYPVTFVLPDGSEVVIQAEERYSLLMASQGLPSPISTGRRAGSTCPDGGCDLCRVEVLDAAGLTVMSAVEKKVMDDHSAGVEYEGRRREPVPAPGPSTRLACHARIIGPGARIKVHALVDFDALRGDDQDG